MTSKQEEIQNELDKIAKEAISPTVVKADFTKKKEKEKENDKQ